MPIIKKAEKLFLDGQQIILASSSCNYYTLGLFNQSMALLQIERNNYNAAIESLNTVLQIAFNNSFDLFMIIQIYSDLGLAYRKASNFDRACENYEKALSIIKQSVQFPKLHPIHSVILNNLAYTKQLQYQYDQSLEYYNLALEIQQKSLPQIHSILATTLSNIALLHMMKNENEKALKTYEKVVIMLTEIYDRNHPRLGIIFYNLGDLSLRMTHYQQAKEYLNKALHIRLNSNDVDADDLAGIFTSLGLVHCHLQSFNDSLRFCFEALHIRSKIPPEKTNNISVTYMALAEYYLFKFDYCQALRYCELAQYRCPPNSINLSWIHEKFSDILNRIERYDEAISHLQISISIQLRSTVQNNISLARSYKDIGLTYESKGEFDEALRYLGQGLDLAPDNLFLMAELNIGIADVRLNLKQFDKVMRYLDLAKEFCDKIVPENHILIAKMLHSTGYLYLKTNNLSYALKNLNDALTIYEKEIPKYHPLVYDVYLQIGITLEKLNKIDEALEIFEKVKTMGLIIYPKNHSLIVPCYHRVSILLRDKNLLEESLNNAENALTTAMLAQTINYHELSRIHIKEKISFEHALKFKNSSNIRQKYCPGDLVLSQINLANIYIKENSMQEAIDLLNKITDDQLLLVHNYSPAKLSKDLAIIYDNLKQNESLLRMTKFALNHITDNEHYIGAEAHLRAAKASWTLGYKPQSLEHLNQVLTMLNDYTSNEYHDKMIINILDNMTRIYKSFNEYHQAITFYQKMLNYCKTEQYAQIHIDIGFCYTELNEMELSYESYQLSRSLCSPTDYKVLSNLHEGLGRYYIRSQKNSEALRHFETALKMRLRYMEPDDFQLDSLYDDLAQLYLESEKYQQAAEFFEKLVEHQLKQDDHENAIKTLVFLGFAHVQQENIQQGITYYELSIELSLNTSPPNYHNATYVYSHMAETYDSDSNPWKCVESYEKAIEMAHMKEPHDDDLLAFLQENLETARQNRIHVERRIVELETTTTTVKHN